MELRDLIYVLGGIIGIAASHFGLRTKIEVQRNDLENHKWNHGKLESRINEHENKIEIRLEKIDAKMDELKTLLIGKMK